MMPIMVYCLMQWWLLHGTHHGLMYDTMMVTAVHINHGLLHDNHHGILHDNHHGLLPDNDHGLLPETMMVPA